jgi:hypothetical protein
MEKAHGVVVRQGGAADLVLRETSSGAQVMSVLKDSSAPTSYRYKIVGGQLHRLTDGTIVVSESAGDGVERVAATIEAPWAADATGKKLPTTYSVAGEYITQTIDTAGAKFPVVADPSVEHEKWIPPTYIVTLNPKDQRIILSSGGAAVGAAIGALLCAAGGPAAALCAAAGALVVTAVAEGIKEYGVKEGCNWKVRVLFPAYIDGTWRSGRC